MCFEKTKELHGSADFCAYDRQTVRNNSSFNNCLQTKAFFGDLIVFIFEAGIVSCIGDDDIGNIQEMRPIWKI